MHRETDVNVLRGTVPGACAGQQSVCTHWIYTVCVSLPCMRTETDLVGDVVITHSKATLHSPFPSCAGIER